MHFILIALQSANFEYRSLYTFFIDFNMRQTMNGKDILIFFDLKDGLRHYTLNQLSRILD